MHFCNSNEPIEKACGKNILEKYDWWRTSRKCWKRIQSARQTTCQICALRNALGIFLWVMFSKWIWNQNINSEVDQIKCILILKLYLNFNCPSHNFSFQFCMRFYWRLKQDSSFHLVFCWNHGCLLNLVAFSRRLRSAAFFGLI